MFARARPELQSLSSTSSVLYYFMWGRFRDWLPAGAKLLVLLWRGLNLDLPRSASRIYSSSTPEHTPLHARDETSLTLAAVCASARPHMNERVDESVAYYVRGGARSRRETPDACRRRWGTNGAALYVSLSRWIRVRTVSTQHTHTHAICVPHIGKPRFPVSLRTLQGGRSTRRLLPRSPDTSLSRVFFFSF